MQIFLLTASFVASCAIVLFLIRRFPLKLMADSNITQLNERRLVLPSGMKLQSMTARKWGSPREMLELRGFFEMQGFVHGGDFFLTANPACRLRALTNETLRADALIFEENGVGIWVEVCCHFGRQASLGVTNLERFPDRRAQHWSIVA